MYKKWKTLKLELKDKSGYNQIKYLLNNDYSFVIEYDCCTTNKKSAP